MLFFELLGLTFYFRLLLVGLILFAVYKGIRYLFEGSYEFAAVAGMAIIALGMTLSMSFSYNPRLDWSSPSIAVIEEMQRSVDEVNIEIKRSIESVPTVEEMKMRSQDTLDSYLESFKRLPVIDKRGE